VFVGAHGQAKILDSANRARRGGGEAAARNDVFDAGSLGAMTLAYASPQMLAHEDPQPMTTCTPWASSGRIAQRPTSLQSPRGERRRQQQLRPAPISGFFAPRVACHRARAQFRAGAPLARCGRVSAGLLRARRLAKSLRGGGGDAIVAAVLAIAPMSRVCRTLPFAKLPAEVQSEIRKHLQQADEAWR